MPRHKSIGPNPLTIRKGLANMSKKKSSKMPSKMRAKRKLASVARMPATRKLTLVTGGKTYDQSQAPLREWDRATQFMSAFAISGWLNEVTAQGEIVPVRPASVILVGGPGSGKTELVERFKRCYWLSFHNDMTLRSLFPLMRRASGGSLTHVAAPEFNKWFQRKSFVAENCVGMLSSAMEEGVKTVSIGGTTTHYEPEARLGLFGAMTPRTMDKRREMLAEMGFLSRTAAIEWQLPADERREILRRMNEGIAFDIEPIELVTPQDGQRALVAWNAKLGEQVQDYVRRHWPENDLRTFKRFKTLMLARAYLVGHEAVIDDEWQWLRGYDDYWQRMIVGED